ncbi:MAG: hypothetical protein JXR83_18660 [Deltaproteobacteria bacterium]|nr:hypothetical protein [Deltaproteobacteria bacterium]
MRASRAAWLVLIAGAASCGPPVAVGTWQVSEIMDHRCRASGNLGMACDGDAALDPAAHRGTILIEELEWGRLRLIDVDGRTTVGRSYSDGARFRWLEKRLASDTGCTTSSDEIVELVTDGDGLSGQRRVYASYSAECGTASVSDIGFVVQATRLAEAP